MSFTVQSHLLEIFTAVRYPGQGQTSGETQWESQRSNAPAQEEQRVTGGLVPHGSLKQLESLGTSK